MFVSTRAQWAWICEKKRETAPLLCLPVRGGSHVPVKRVGVVSGDKKKKRNEKESGGAPQNQAGKRENPEEEQG